jgi:hypothetical protein
MWAPFDIACNRLWLLKNYFRGEIARKFVCKWLIVRSRNNAESHEITVLVPFSTATPVINNRALTLRFDVSEDR